jgi:hypothetical protein
MKFTTPANIAYHALSFATIISSANASSFPIISSVKVGFECEPIKIKYPGLILSTVKLTHLPNSKTFDELEDGDEVFFRDFSENGSKAAFLEDIVQTDITVFLFFFRTRTFKAKFASGKKAFDLARAKKGYTTTVKYDYKVDGFRVSPLFCVHGFTVQPSDVFETMAKARNQFMNRTTFYPIPVVWSTRRLTSLRRYRQDQIWSSIEAGGVLNALLNSFSNKYFFEKSLMMHSMGNHVVLNGVLGLNEKTPDVRFDNIFMVAAVSNIGISSIELSLCRSFSSI